MGNNYITKEKSREIMLELLNAIDFLCQKNNIRYYLCGGTLLGAIRHKGFIPWDDDIDILLFRNDFEKLRDILKKQTEFENFSLLDNTVEGYVYPFLKFVDNRTIARQRDLIVKHGIWVDIFPYDAVPSTTIKRYWFLKTCQINRAILLSSVTDFSGIEKFSKKGFAKMILFVVGHIVGVEKMVQITEKHMKKYNGGQSKYVCCNFSPYVMREYIEYVKVFENTKVDFEGRKYDSFKNWDEYLSKLYGDYMKIPPKNKQRTHNITAKWGKNASIE